jgi:CHAD domain-containing protein
MECIDVALLALDEPEGRDAAIHTVRKQCKQARALLRLFHFGLRDDGRGEMRIFRDIGRALSVARDGRVVLDVHERLNEEFDVVIDPAVRAAVRQDLIADWQARVNAAKAQGGSMIDHEELRARLRAARSRARRWEVVDGSEDVVRRGLVRSYHRARKAHRRAARSMSIEDFHEARKRAKDYYHALEFLAVRYPDVASERIASAKKLAEHLGDAHDFDVYRKASARAAASRNPAGVDLLHALTGQRSRTLEADAIALSRTVFADKPASFAALLEQTVAADRAAS